MRSRRRLATLAYGSVASVLVLAACTGEDSNGDADGDGGEAPAAGEEQPAEMAGFEACLDEPNTCNSGETADGGTVTWAITSEPGAWNTFSPEGGSVYTLHLLQGIYPFTGTFLPDGSTWEWNFDLLADEPQLVSEDPQTWEYVIREEAVWNDGTPITAADFEVTWKLGTSEAEGHCVGCRPRQTAESDQIASIEGSDDGKTVTVTLKDGQANPEWFTLMGPDDIGGGIMPAHVAEQNGFDVSDPQQLGEYFEWLQANRPEFSGGPYILAEGEFNQQVIKEPNPMWYGDDVPLDTLVMRVLTETDTWVPALDNGEIDGGSPFDLDHDVVRALQDRPNIYSRVQSGPSWEHVDLNMDVPEFEDIALRRAIFTAIDTDNIAERNFGDLFPEYEPRTNHLFTSNSPYHEDLLTGTGYGTGDVEAAMGLLNEAGYTLEGDTLMRDGEQIGPFRLRSTSVPLRATAMELIQADLAEIGVEVNIEPTDDLGGMLGTQDYDIAMFGWSGTPTFFADANQFWHSESGSNFGKYSNPEVDRITEEELTTVDADDAADLANQAARLVMDDAYVLPLFNKPVFDFARDTLANVRDNTSTSARNLYNVQEWGLLPQ